MLSTRAALTLNAQLKVVGNLKTMRRSVQSDQVKKNTSPTAMFHSEKEMMD